MTGGFDITSAAARKWYDQGKLREARAVAGFLLDEHLVALDQQRVLAWADNLSSHRDLSFYYRQVLDLQGQCLQDLDVLTRLEPPSAEDIYASLPVQIASVYHQQNLLPDKLPDRLPQQIWADSTGQRLFLDFVQQLPLFVLRVLDLQSQQLVDHALDGWSPRGLSPDGKWLLATQYPFHKQYGVFELAAGCECSFSDNWPDELRFGNAVSWLQGWWGVLHQKKDYFLQELSPQGQPLRRLALPGRPGQLATCGQLLVLDSGQHEILLVNTADLGLQVLSLERKKSKNNALRFSGSPNGRFLACRGSQDQLLAVYDLQQQSWVLEQPLKNKEQTLENGETLHYQPGFLCLNDRLLTLSKGQLKSIELPL